MVAPKKTISVKTIGVASSGLIDMGVVTKIVLKRCGLFQKGGDIFSNMIQYFITSGATAFTLD